MIIAAGFLLLQPTLLPRYAFEKGTARTYHLYEKFTESGTTSSLESTFTEVVTVASILSPGRAKLEVKRTPTKLVMDGQSVPVGSPPPVLLSEERNQRGETRNRNLPPIARKENGRIQRLLDLVYPEEVIKAGSKWPASQPENLPFAPCVWNYSLVSADAAGFEVAVKFSESLSERPITAKGTFHVDRISGWIDSAEIEAENVQAPGDELLTPQHLSLRLRRVK